MGLVVLSHRGLIVWGYGVYIQASERDLLNMILHLIGIVLHLERFIPP